MTSVSEAAVVVVAAANGDGAVKARKASAVSCIQVTVPTTVTGPTDSSRWAAVTRLFNRHFDDSSVEELYQNYCQRTKATQHLDCFFLTGCLVAVHTAVAVALELHQSSSSSSSSGSSEQVQSLVCAGLSSVLAVAQASLGFYARSGPGRKRDVAWLTYTAWLLANALILGLLVLVPVSADRPLTWLLLVNFLTCVTLPLRLRVCLLLTASCSVLFLIVSALVSRQHQQVGPSFSLLTKSLALGQHSRSTVQ